MNKNSKIPLIFWVTGLSGSGKSTICEIVKKGLISKLINAHIIDGDNVRNKFHQQLGFEFEDVRKNNLLICQLIEENFQSNDIVLVPVIAPYEKIRQEIKNKFRDNIKLIFCNASLETVSQRDVKGLYKKSKEGIIKNMIGYSKNYEYELPNHPDLVLNTGSHSESPEMTASILTEYILKILKEKISNGKN
jgi:adenylylsulfate kinase